MAILITDDEFAEFRVLFNDIQDTFYQEVITYCRDRNTATATQRDIRRRTEKFNLNAIVVWSTTKEDAELVRSLTGAYDGNTGYCNVKFDQMQTLGLIDSQDNLIENAAQDSLLIGGKSYPVLGVIKLGQWKDKEVVVKILFRKGNRNVQAS